MEKGGSEEGVGGAEEMEVIEGVTYSKGDCDDRVYEILVLFDTIFKGASK